MHCRAICYANSELLRPVCGSLAYTQANCPPTHVLEHFVTPNLQNTNNYDVPVYLYFPFNLFAREGAALRVGLATIRTCHVY